MNIDSSFIMSAPIIPPHAEKVNRQYTEALVSEKALQNIFVEIAHKFSLNFVTIVQN